MLNTKGISEILGVSEETVRRWIRTGELEAVQDGKSYHVDEEVLKDFIEKKASTPGTSLSRINGLINLGAGIITHPKAKELTSEIINKNLIKFLKASTGREEKENTVSDLQDQLAALKRRKKKLDLEHEIKLLEIEDEIAYFEKLIKEKQ